MTKGERSLVRDGQADLVLGTRKACQRTMRQDLFAGIEQILQRKVVAFMSDNHIDPDMAIEAFVLAPTDHNGAAAQPPWRGPTSPLREQFSAVASRFYGAPVAERRAAAEEIAGIGGLPKLDEVLALY